MSNVQKSMGFLILPVALTSISYILFADAAELPNTLVSVVPYIAYTFFTAGMLLGIGFNKSRLFFLCMVLVMSQLLLSNSFTQHMADILSFLIPINILLFSISRERGIFTVWGRIKLGAIAVQALFVRLIIDPPNHEIRSLISYKLINMTWFDSVTIPQISILLFFIVLGFAVIRLFLNPTLIDSSLIGVIMLVFAGILKRSQTAGLSLFFAAAGLLLLTSLVEATYSMAYRDQLTGLPSRRSLEESMLKLGNKFSIAMLDIDFFKKFNDTYGHDIGDKVLQKVASSLMKAGIGGKVFRYGGEEFTILFPNRSQIEVLPLLEDLRKSIAKEKHVYKKKSKDKVVAKRLGVTVSIGIAEKNDKYKTPDEVMQAADKALYRAKKNGRNCVSK